MHYWRVSRGPFSACSHQLAIHLTQHRDLAWGPGFCSVKKIKQKKQKIHLQCALACMHRCGAGCSITYGLIHVQGWAKCQAIVAHMYVILSDAGNALQPVCTISGIALDPPSKQLLCVLCLHYPRVRPMYDYQSTSLPSYGCREQRGRL